MYRATLMIAATLCTMLTSQVTAGLIEDFEGAWSEAGVVVPDPDDAGNNALFLTGGQSVTLSQVGDGIVTIDVYDFGAVAFDEGGTNPGNNYGPRWGVGGNSNATSAAATIINKTFLGSFAGYGRSTETSKTGSWFSPGFYGGPRYVDSLAVIGSGSAEQPEVPGDGAWSTWSIKILGGQATITDNKSSNSWTAGELGSLSSHVGLRSDRSRALGGLRRLRPR